LRSIPNKLGGVIALVISIAILYFLPFIKNNKRNSFRAINQCLFWNLVAIFVVLIYIGAKPVEAPFEKVGQLFTIVYFLMYIIISWKDSLF
jgi:ubiquinol-cytochrome c reductase cytochrome b subunit